MSALQAGTWKADEIGADTEARTLARRSPDTRAYDIQCGEYSRGDNAQGDNLIKGETVTRNKKRSHGNKQPLN